MLNSNKSNILQTQGRWFAIFGRSNNNNNNPLEWFLLPKAIENNKWYHLKFIRKDNIFSLYVDGIKAYNNYGIHPDGQQYKTDGAIVATSNSGKHTIGWFAVIGKSGNDNPVEWLLSPVSIENNQWYHIKITRSWTGFDIYVDNVKGVRNNGIAPDGNSYHSNGLIVATSNSGRHTIGGEIYSSLVESTWYISNLQIIENCDKNPCDIHDPCQNDGICIPTSEGSTTCDCSLTNFKGDYCDIAKVDPCDIEIISNK